MSEPVPDPDAAGRYLAGVRERYLAAAAQARTSNPARSCREDIPRLLKAVEAALAGHRRSALPATSGERRGEHYCLDCTPSIDHQTIYATWPCKRYRAIAKALTGEEPS